LWQTSSQLEGASGSGYNRGRRHGRQEPPVDGGWTTVEQLATRRPRFTRAGHFRWRPWRSRQRVEAERASRRGRVQPALAARLSTLV